jgi:hypothetical protein
MTIRILVAGGYDGDLRRDRRKKFRHGRVLTPVVCDFEYVSVQNGSVVFVEHGILRLLFRVTGQENGAISVAQAHHQRIIVLRRG